LYDPDVEESWLSYVLGAATVGAIAAVYTWSQRRKPDARQRQDRLDPRKAWAQAVMAIYQGDAGDAGYWDRQRATGLIQKGWSTPDAAALTELIERYVHGECNVGFDKIRIVWLARLGFAAGWYDEATSWRYVFAAQTALQQAYGSWLELRAAVEQGRAQWYGGAAKVPEMQVRNADQNFSYAYKLFLGQLPYR
jgi:hypothetical protein